MSDSLDVLAVGMQMNQPVIVWHPPGKDCLKIVEQVAAAIKCPLISPVDLASIRNPYVLSGRYMREDVPGVYDETETVSYREPKKEDLIAPDWLMEYMRGEATHRTVLFENLMVAREDIRRIALRMMLRDADRFDLPAYVRMVASSPEGNARFLGENDESEFVQVALTGDETVDPKRIPVVMKNWDMFVGRWATAVGMAMEKDVSLIAGETGSGEEKKNRTIKGWENATRMIAGAETAGRSPATLRRMAEACVGSIKVPEWDLIVKSYANALSGEE